MEGLLSATGSYYNRNRGSGYTSIRNDGSVCKWHPAGRPRARLRRAPGRAMTAAARPLRADALRNRQRVLEVAQEVLATEGIGVPIDERSEEHTSELQSQSNLVCR